MPKFKNFKIIKLIVILALINPASLFADNHNVFEILEKKSLYLSSTLQSV